jgi:hypothetical protein
LGAKVGIRIFFPHFHNIADNQSIAELRTKKSCVTATADLQNLTSAIPQLSAVSGQFPYFIVSFPQLKMFSKINQKQFLQSSLPMETKKLALTTVA